MSPVTIRDIRVILTEPDDIRLLVVKVETSEPGLFGLGCATFTMRPSAVKAAIEDYLRPFLLGWDVADIEDIWQSSYVSSYWRNGPVLNNALSGVDMALWDIKGKMAGMPVYDLLGGKAREAAAVYVHASGDVPEAVETAVRSFMEDGFHHVRVQVDTPGFEFNYGTGIGTTETDLAYGRVEMGGPVNGPRPAGPRWITRRLRNYERGVRYQHPAGVFEPKPYIRSAIGLFEHLRDAMGGSVELLHDVHERLPPALAVKFAQDMEHFEPFFLEDLFAPEDNDYFRAVRRRCATPLAMGEIYSNPQEIIPVIKDRLIDFLRVHVSYIGGITPAKKLAALCEAFGVRTAWHGPGDTSPVGHAANLMLDLSSTSFGIQEYAMFLPRTREVFPGCPEVRDGFMWPNGRPGLGIDIDEDLAAKYPFREQAWGGAWDTLRRADGTMVRP